MKDTGEKRELRRGVNLKVGRSIHNMVEKGIVHIPSGVVWFTLSPESLLPAGVKLSLLNWSPSSMYIDNTYYFLISYISFSIPHVHTPVLIMLMTPDKGGLLPAQLRAVMLTWYSPEEFRVTSAIVSSLYMTSVALSTVTWYLVLLSSFRGGDQSNHTVILILLMAVLYWETFRLTGIEGEPVNSKTVNHGAKPCTIHDSYNCYSTPTRSVCRGVGIEGPRPAPNISPYMHVKNRLLDKCMVSDVETT